MIDVTEYSVVAELKRIAAANEAAAASLSALATVAPVISQTLDGIAASLVKIALPNPPVSGVVLLLDCPTTWEFFQMAKAKGLKGMVAVPTFTLAELASKGALIQLFDAGDNPSPLPTTPYTTTWTADGVVLTVAPNATDPSQATVSSTGKTGTVPVSCLVHATDTPPSFADINAQCNVVVPAGPPTQGTIALAP